LGAYAVGFWRDRRFYNASNLNAYVKNPHAKKIENLSADERAVVREIFENFGAVYELEEAKFAAFTGIAGSLPAYVFMFIEAAADAGVLEGLPRALGDAAVRRGGGAPFLRRVPSGARVGVAKKASQEKRFRTSGRCNAALKNHGLRGGRAREGTKQYIV